MVIEWDVIIAEMSILAGIIYFSVYLEHWTYNRSQKGGRENKAEYNKIHRK